MLGGATEAKIAGGWHSWVYLDLAQQFSGDSLCGSEVLGSPLSGYGGEKLHRLFWAASDVPQCPSMEFVGSSEPWEKETLGNRRSPCFSGRQIREFGNLVGNCYGTWKLRLNCDWVPWCLSQFVDNRVGPGGNVGRDRDQRCPLLRILLPTND